MQQFNKITRVKGQSERTYDKIETAGSFIDEPKQGTDRVKKRLLSKRREQYGVHGKI